MFRPLVLKLKSWVFVAYLIMAAYLIVDGAAYLTTPYSGRISTFTCSENEQGASECKITIFGFTEIYQRSFLIKDVREVINHYGYPGASSESRVCGITIKTYSGKINFIYRYHNCRKVTETADKINEIIASSNCSPTKRIVYNGLNPSLYRRAFLLVVGLLIVLIWGKSWSKVPLDKSSHAKDIKAAFRRFAFSWWKINILLKVFFYLSIFFISGIWTRRPPTLQGDFLSELNFYLKPLDFSINGFVISFDVLLCLYPLIALAILQAYVQWKFLREKLPISGWWVGAPIIANLLLAFSLPADLIYSDCLNLKFLLSGFWMLAEKSPILWNLIIYLLLVGGIQWLVLRRRLAYSSGWVLMPFINVSLLPLIYFVIWQLHSLSSIEFLIMVFVIPIFVELIPSIYLSWVIYSKNSDFAGQS
jgi:hypothetical protein